MNRERSIIWRRLNVAGHEFARIFSEGTKHFLEGVSIFLYEKKFCRLDYSIKCNTDWKTEFAFISGFIGEKRIECEISVDLEKRWTMNGAEVSDVENCIDIDLNFSPVTNTLPIRRLNLKVGEKSEVRAAWLRFPSFALEPLEQIYERTGENEYRYESAGGAFQTQIGTDDFGLAIKYPNFWEIEK